MRTKKRSLRPVKVPLILQMEALECGAACLAMILAYYDKWIPLEQVRVNCETHLFDFSGDLYGKQIRTAFYAYLRPERKFESADALRAAIASDAQRARDYFENFT